MRILPSSLYALAFAVLLFSCSTQDLNNSSDTITGDGFELSVLPQSLLDAASAGDISIKTTTVAQGVEVAVETSAAVGLKALYFTLSYDPARYSPLSSTSSRLLAGATGQVLELAVLDEPGLLQHGQVLARWPDHEGFSGDGRLATVLFARRAFTPETARAVSDAPTSELSRALLDLDPGLMQLHWYYYHQGDYDQNGDTNISDLTPLGANFGAAGPFDFKAAISCVDGDNNALITIADITPIGANFGRRVSSYEVSYSNSNTDYPATNDGPNGPGTFGAGSVPFSGAVFTAGFRKEFVYSIAGLDPLAFYWVRPVDETSIGTPSNMASGAGNTAPTVSLLADATSGNAPLHVTFTANASDMDGAIVLYEWDLDGDAIYESSGPGNTAVFDYTADGSYSAKVRVLDNGGLEASASQVITVVPVGANIPPTALLSAAPVLGEAPLTVDFDASGSSDPDGVIAEYRFDFDGDGIFDLVTGTALHSFQYTVPGTYSAELEVADDDGAASSDVQVIQVNPPPGWHYQTIHASDDDVGNQSVLLEVGGLPMVIYWNRTQQDLYYMRATDVLGEFWAAPEIIDDSGLVGDMNQPDASEIAAMVIGGRPAVAYNRDDTLYFRRASDAEGGLPWGEPALEVDDGGLGQSGEYVSMAFVNGNPGMAYHDNTNGHLRYVRAATSDGLDWTDPAVTVHSVPGLDLGQSTSLAVVNGLPCISYYDNTNFKAAFARSLDVNGAADWNFMGYPSEISGLGYTGTALIDSGGLPAFFAKPQNLTDSTTLFFLRAQDAAMTSWTILDCFPGEEGTLKSQPCSILDDIGRPLVAFYWGGAGVPGFAFADDTAGSGFSEIQIVDNSWSEASAATGLHPSLAIIGGKPCISYGDDTNKDLKFSIYY